MEAYHSRPFTQTEVRVRSEETTIPRARMQKCLLIDFPNLKLAGVIISEWMTIWDLGRLDSAVCNRQRDLRSKYLKIFGATAQFAMYSSVCNAARIDITEDNRRVICSADGLRFLLKRNIALTTCALTVFLEKNVLLEYFRRFGAKLQVLEFCGHIGNVDSWQLYYELFQYCPRLRAVLFHTNSSVLCPQDVWEITQCCPLLQRLQVQNGFHLTVPRNVRPYEKVQPNLTITALVQLRTFTLHSFSKSTLALTTALATECPALTSVDLTGCTGLNDAALLKLATDGVCTLEAMNLNQCSKLTCTGIVAFLTANGAKNASLRDLHLSKTECTNDVLQAIAAQCRNLRVLDIRQCRHFTEVGVTAVAQGCTALTELSLMNNDALTDDCVELLALHCPQLHTLRLHSCSKLTDAALLSISTHCAILEMLDIGGRSQISEEAFIAALQQAVTLPGARSSNVVPEDALDGSNSPSGGDDSNSDARAVASRMEVQDTQDAEDTEDTNGTGPITLVTTFGSRLTDLDVSDRATLGDASLLAIAAHCANLVRLNVSGLKRIADSSVVALATALSAVPGTGTSIVCALRVSRQSQLTLAPAPDTPSPQHRPTLGLPVGCRSCT